MQRTSEPAHGGKDKSGQPNYPPGFLDFDRLPNEAKVPVRTYALIEGISMPTAWRRAANGDIKFSRHGGVTRVLVGDIRRARAVEAK